MALIKVGNYYWPDIRIKGKRIRRSLRTTNKLKALDKFGEIKEHLESKYLDKMLKFSEFCKQYFEWAWSSKPASTPREKQRLKKIQDFFEELEIEYLSDITPFSRWA
ncbi:MAG: hypothetical protein WBC02_08335 [Candidatus Aminicenantaceae bacterium]